MTTKQAEIARRAEWAKAVDEGRVVKFASLGYFRSFVTVAGAVAAVENAADAGIDAYIVSVVPPVPVR